MTVPEHAGRVVVVGAGLAGISVAAPLAATRAVVVVDRGAPGAEASSQNAGMLRRMGEDPYERALAMRTHERLIGEAAFRQVSRQTGAVLAFGRDPHHLHDAAAHLALAGVPHVWRDRPDLPALTGSPVLGGWWLPEERVVDPWALLQVLLAQGRAQGMEVRRGTVERVVVGDDGRVCGVRVGGGLVAARDVVIAAGAWSQPLGRTAGVDRPLVPLRRSLLLTAPDPRASADHPWCWVDDEGVYARPEGGGWLVSGCDEAIDPPGDGDSRGPLEPEPRGLALSKLGRWFPSLPTVVRGGWTGLRTFAPDRRPLLGRDPDVSGLWWVAGLGGFGVSCALAAGEVVAAWMQGSSVGYLRPRGVSPGRPPLRRFMVRPTGDLARAVPVDIEVQG